MRRPPIERLGADLRERRRRLVGYEQATRGEWEADLVAYDDVLLQAATMLEVDVVARPEPGEALPPDRRAQLETRLAAAGLDVRTTDI